MVEAGGTNVIESYPCTICGCTCDDIRITVVNGRVIAAENACPVGVAGLTADLPQSNVEAWIDGESATLAAAVDRATGILRSAKSPLVYAGVDSTIESQRLAVQIAQRTRGVLDSPAFAASAIFPDIGMVACSLGEAKNRADLVVLWNCDPTVTHPRLLSHYLLDPPGYFRPKGRSDRTLVIVGNAQLANGIQPDDAIQLPHGNAFEQLWQLRSVVRRELVNNVPLRNLAERMRAAQFGILVLDESVGPNAIQAAYALAMDLQSTTRFSVLVLRRGGNTLGIQHVVSWLTGVPGPVSFRRTEQPEWGNEYCTNRLLSRGAIDAALLIGAEPTRGLRPECGSSLSQIPQIIVSSQAASFAQTATVAILVAPFPVSSQGTVFRMDGVSMPLPLAIPTSVPDEFAVLSQFIARLPPV